ncbi:helix-turn-helix transcriptional regulator [Listeria rocourtiae]|uniref:helix-turn-helix domain-containing protein n=1 Tax=Listeria rocourtiae TaxID=647910 RepID=UPI00162A6302|nr:helix-turn-helix transcriptional regulator [Listeria rocourtiae]MBC1604451.1 helix-turn-helix transcriptional regulator [Listeria rocourtiae]
MAKDFGTELRDLRAVLNVSQKELSNNFDIISKSSLQRIEKNEQNPAFDIAMKLIDQLDMRADEMEYRLNDFSISEKEKLIIAFRNIGSSANVKGIRTLLKKMTTFLETENSSYIYSLTLILRALLVFQEEQTFLNAKKIVQPVWETLKERDEWLYKDMLLIANILYMFDGKTFEIMKKRLLTFLEKNYHLGTVNKLYVVTLMNSVLYMKKNNRFLEAEEELELAITHAKKINEHVRYLDALSLKSELLWIKGEKDAAIELAKKSFARLYCLEEYDILKDNQKDWDELTGMDSKQMIKVLTEFI